MVWLGKCIILLIEWSAEPETRSPPSKPLGECIVNTASLCLFNFFLYALTYVEEINVSYIFLKKEVLTLIAVV